MAKKATVKQLWKWQDDYRMEIAGKDNSEIFALLNHFEGSRVASERTMECALMLRRELSQREAAFEKVVA